MLCNRKNENLILNNDEVIPKIIHYCWFGNSEIPVKARKCIESWKNFMPDFEILEWNEANSPMNHPYMIKAYEQKKWSNLSNYTRLYALIEMGGWYFDTDVEVIKTPNLSKFKETCFLGLETKANDLNYVVNNAIIASKANEPFIIQCYNSICTNYDGTELANLSSPILTTDELNINGFNGLPGVIDNVRVLPNDFFYPSAWYETYTESMSTENTVCIHHNDGSWIPISELANDEIISILKENARLSRDLSVFYNARISFMEYLRLNYKYCKYVLRRFINNTKRGILIVRRQIFFWTCF